MKKLLKFIPFAFSAFLVVGCGSNPSSGGGSEGGGGSFTPSYSYTAEDIKYFTEEDELIFTYKNKSFYKSYSGFCAVALANIGSSCGPVLVGEDPVQVQFSTSVDGDNYAAGGSVVVNEKTYYYSQVKGFASGKLTSTSKFEHYVATATTLEGVATELAKIATFVPVEESKKEYFKFSELTNGKYEVKAGAYASVVEDLVIPAQHKGIDVDSVGYEAFYGFTNLKSVRFEEGSKLTKIDQRAFLDCKNLKYGLVPTTVKSVGFCAFYNCPNLLLFNGVESGTNIYNSSYASDDTMNYRSFWGYKDYFVDDNYVYALNLDDEFAIIRYVGSSVEVVIPASYNEKPVKHIEEYAFANNATLKNVSFPSSLITIRESAFEKCVRLEKAVLPEGLTIIQTRAFDGCTNLRYAVIPTTIKTVAWCAFYSCPNLLIFNGVESPNDKYSSAYADNDVENYASFWGYTAYYVDDDYVYALNLDDELAIIRYIGSSVDFVIPSEHEGKAVCHIEQYAFSEQNMLKNVVFPSSLKRINQYAFYNCVRLEKVRIPSGTLYVGQRAFCGCTRLVYAIIPESVAFVGFCAFDDCGTADIFLELAYTPSAWSSNWRGSSTALHYSNAWHYVDGEPILY